MLGAASPRPLRALRAARTGQEWLEPAHDADPCAAGGCLGAGTAHGGRADLRCLSEPTRATRAAAPQAAAAAALPTTLRLLEDVDYKV
jgi:hypothetical protein